MTARLDPAMFGSEQLVDGEVRIIPNLLAFDKYSLVAIMCREHYLDMAALAAKGCVVKGIEALVRRLPEGKGERRRRAVLLRQLQLHAHVGREPRPPACPGHSRRAPDQLPEDDDREERRLPRARKGGLLGRPRRRGDAAGRARRRQDGRVFWYTPFAPKGNIDVGCVFRAPSLFALDGADWADFGQGFNKVLAYLDRENVAGFNLSIFSAPDDEDHFRVNGRIVARRFLPPVNAADVSYFEKLHMESACMVAPEDVAAGLRGM